MAIAQTGVNLNFTANTAAASAQIAALEKRLATLQGLMGKRVRMAAFDTSGFDVRINSQVRAMDDLTKRIQKGTITSKEFNDTIHKRNGLLEYQQKLNRATAFSSASPFMRSGQAIASVDTRTLQRTSSALREGAVAMSTYGAAAGAYGQQVMNLGKNMAFMGRQALLSVTGPVALIAAGGAAAFYQYDKQLTNIVKLSGDSDKAFKASSESIRTESMELARDMSQNLGVTIKDSLKLQETFAALGKSGKDLSSATKDAGRLMVLGDLDPDTAIKFTNTIQTVFEASAEETQKYVDLINEMENSTVLTMQDVSDSLPKIGPILKSMNMEVKDGLVMLEALKRGGVDPVVGANAVKSVTGSVFRSTEKLQKLYAQMVPGDDWEEMVERNGSNMINILKDLGGRMADWDTPKKMRLMYQIAGKEQAANFVQLTNGLVQGNDQVTQTLAKGEEELRAIAKQEISDIMASTSKQFDVQIQRAMDFLQKIGSKVLPPIVSAMTGFFDMLGKGVSIVGSVMDALGPIGDAIGFIGKMSVVALAGFGPLLLAISAMALIRGGMWKVTSSLATGTSAVMNKMSGGPFASPGFINMQQKAQELAAKSQSNAQLTNKQTTQQLTAAIDKLTASYQRMAAASGAATTATSQSTAAQRAAVTRAASTASANNATNPALMPMALGPTPTPAQRAQQVRLANQRAADAARVTPTPVPFSMQNSALRRDVNTQTNNAQNTNRLTSANGGVWVQNTRGNMSRINSNGVRSNVGTTSAGMISRQFTNGVLQNNNTNARAMGALNVSSGLASQQARQAAMTQRSIAAMNLPAINPLIRQATVSQNAFTMATNQSAQAVSRGLVASYSSLPARQANVLQLQNRINSAISATPAINPAVARQDAMARMNAQILGAPGSNINNARQGYATSGVITAGVPSAAAAADRQATAQANAAASAQRMGQSLGGVLMVTGLLTSALGGTNEVVSKIAAGISILAISMMMIPQLATLAGKGLALMFAKITLGMQAMSMLMPTLAGGMKSFGASIMAAGPALLAVAAVAATIYTINRAVTASSREYVEHLEAVNKSAKTHAEILGFTLLEYGQVLDAQGEVQETADSLAKKYASDENANSGFLGDLKANIGDIDAMNLTLSKEAIKIKARGGSDEDISKMVEAALIAAGADKATIDSLKVNFENVDFAQMTMLGPKMQEEVRQLTTGINGMGASFGDQFWAGFGIQGDHNQSSASDLSDAARPRIDAVVESIVTQLATATDEKKGEVAKMYGDMLATGMTEAVESGNQDRIDNAKKSIEYLLQGLAEKDPANFAQFQNNKDLEFIKKAGDIQTIMGAVGNQFKDTRVATDFYNQSLTRLSGLMGKDLDANQKGMLINLIRMGNGWTKLGGDANDAGSELGKAVSEGNIGPDLRGIATDSNNAADAVGGLAKAGEALEDMNVNWDIIINVDGAGGLNDLEMTLGGYKEAMQQTQSDMFDAASRIGQEQFDATMNTLKAAQDESLKAFDNVAKEQEEKAKQAEKAMDKAQELEKKAFDKGWEDREKSEKKMFEDRIQALEDVGEKEDELDRQRQRNNEREAARLRYLAQLATNNVDMNTALASGDMDTASKLSINAGVQANDFSKETEDREAGYRKDDSDRSRKTAIDLIKDEEEARMEMLKNQKEQEREAMEERFTIQKEEFDRKRQLEQEDLAAKKEALQAEFAATNANEQAMFAANQRRMQMELDTLRATLPRTTEEMNKQKAQIEDIYLKYGVQLQGQGTEWSEIIGNSLEQRMQKAQATMADQRAWNDFGQRVSDGITQGSFNMSSAEFNNFLRTGDMPGAAARGMSVGLDVGTRHGGGPVSTVSRGFDKYNNRGGIPKNAPMRSSETMLLAKKDEYVVRGKAHKKYGTDFFNKLNSGAINPNVIRHDGGPIDQEQSGQATTVRHEGGPTGIAGLGAALAAAGIGAIISRATLATGKAMTQAIASGTMGGEFIGAGAAAEAVAFAKRESGKPYQYGGGGNPSWDCSGFMGAIWKILVGRDPLGRVFSTEDFRNGGGTKFGFKPGLDPDFPNGFSMGFKHGPGGGANSHVAGTLLGANVESGGTNGVQYGAKAWGANNPYFHDFWHLPGVSGTKPKAADDSKGPNTSQYDDWTTVGIQKFGSDAMAKFGGANSGGGALGEVLTGNREFYIKEIVDEAKRRRLTKKAAVIALMTAMQESSLLMYANSNVPASLALPHDRVGSDHDSVGLFQQRGNGAWGSLEQRMNARASAGAFYNALAKFNYEQMDEGQAAQKVQVSAFPGAYKKWQGDATAQANRYFDQGGLAHGKGFLPKDVIKPERVLSPAQTAAFENLVPLLTGANKGIVGFKPIINAIKNDSSGMISAAKNATADALNKAGVQMPPLEMTFINKGNINSQLDLDAWAEQIKKETIEEISRRQRLAERKIK